MAVSTFFVTAAFFCVARSGAEILAAGVDGLHRLSAQGSNASRSLLSRTSAE
jgi:hypothetical protein